MLRAHHLAGHLVSYLWDLTLTLFTLEEQTELTVSSPSECHPKIAHLTVRCTVKTCVKRPLKIDKAKILMTNGSLMKAISIGECSR